MEGQLKRFSVSLPAKLVEKFDKQIKKEAYPTRSKALGDLIKKSLVENEWTTGNEISGAIILVYDHHKRSLASKLMHVQHDFHHIIISSQHIHMDHDNCMEIIAIKGKFCEVKALIKNMKRLKGINYTSLSMSSTKI